MARYLGGRDCSSWHVVANRAAPCVLVVRKYQLLSAACCACVWVPERWHLWHKVAFGSSGRVSCGCMNLVFIRVTVTKLSCSK